MHRASGFRSRNAVLIVVPLVVLTVIGLIFGRSVLGSSSGTALASASVGGALPATAPTGSATGTAPPTAAALLAPKLRDLGVARGSFTLKGPSKAARGSFVVFVVDGPKRVLKTDAKAPFRVRLNTLAMPNGTYTVTVLWSRKGRSSVVSTGTVKIRNVKPTRAPSATTPGSGGGTGTGGTPGTNTGVTGQVVSLTNAERAKAGCPALSVNAELTVSAQGHSADMAAHNYFSHDSQDGRSPFDRIKANGYSFSAAAENIAMGQQTPSDVVTAWMNSAGHRANILNCTYTEIGVGYAVGNGAPYWTQDFGKRL